MTDLEKYEAVNKCESLKALSKVILSFADNLDTINGRIRAFSASSMAERCLKFSIINPNILTRMWGIRQQAMYIVHYPVGSLEVKPYVIKGES